MKKINQKFSVGLDLGGTKLAAALVDAKGNILSFHKESIVDLKLDAKNGPRKIAKLMAQIVLGFKDRFPTAFQKKSFAGVGLASAGPLNVEQGSLIYPVNFPKWGIVPIQDLLRQELKKLKLPDDVTFQNDAVSAAFAEGWIGGAQDLESYAIVTIGTGIGTGVIFRQKPVQFAGMGSEFGHLILQNQNIESADDLAFNTVEGIASGTGILRQAKQMGFKGDSVEELVSLLENGETRYQKLFDQSALALAALCYDLSIGFHLQKILFSGGLIKVRHLYFPLLKKRYEELITRFNPRFKCSLQIAKCLNQAGVIGAASLPYKVNG